MSRTPVTEVWNPNLVWEFEERPVTEQKLDAQQGNADYVRELLRHRVIATSGICLGGYFADVPGLTHTGTNAMRLRFQMSTETDLVTSKAAMQSGAPAHVQWQRISVRNILWSPSPGDGVGTLVVTPEFEQPAGGVWVAASDPIAVFPNVRTTDETIYFSAWADAVPFWNDSEISVAILGLTVVAGRLDEEFPEVV